MPSQYTMNTIPKPKNADVKLREIPGKLFAVNSFTGFNTQSRIQAKTDELSAWIGQKSLKVLGQTQLARYDPPWTLPMFRRNEVMIEVEDVKERSK
jgi:RNase P/RNase MRP subunit POP5